MKMTDYQQNIWKSMIDLIQSYLDGETEDFYSMVGKLEGALDVSEIKDIALVNRWYDLWTPLEIRRVIEGNNLNKTKAIEELRDMQNFLIENIDTHGDS